LNLSEVRESVGPARLWASNFEIALGLPKVLRQKVLQVDWFGQTLPEPVQSTLHPKTPLDVPELP
jgi:hypothetical protein